jgi:tRNA 2-thiouridine synthesizing protein A
MGLFGPKKARQDRDAPAGAVTLGDGATYRVARRIDCRGDSCPRPQLMTKKALGEINRSEVIEVLVDNPSSVEALPPMCPPLDASHLETVKADRCWRVYIRKN